MSSQTNSYEDLLQKAFKSLEVGHFSQLRITLNSALPIIEVARLLESSTETERKTIWRLLEQEKRFELIEHLDESIAKELLEDTEIEDFPEYLKRLDDDDAVDLIGTLPNKLLDKVLEHMEAHRRERLEQLLNYPKNSAGGLLNTDFIVIPEGVTLAVLQRYIRIRKELPKDTDFIFVVHEKTQRLLGKLPISALLLNPLEMTVSDCMEPSEPYFSLTDSAEKIAEIFEDHDLVTAPVVDERMRPVGRITVDDVLDSIREKEHSSFLSFARLKKEDSPFIPIHSSVALRTFWLALNLLTTSATVILVYLFSDVMKGDVRLAAWAPTVASMGGIVTTQTFTLIVRAMAQDRLVIKRWRLFVRRELFVGILNGLIWGILISAVVSLISNDIYFGALVGSSVLLNIIWAGFWGALLPVFLKKLGIDAALSGSVILTTFTDLMGYASLLGLATLLVHFSKV